MTRILVVEDEPGIALGLEDDLRLEGWHVELAADGALGARRAREEQFDLILLDVMLPNKDGFDVCREVRRAGIRTPIIMLTAKAQEAEKIMGLDLGADDYVTKPFSMRELIARVRALLRRHEPMAATRATLQRGGLVIDPSAHSVFVAGRAVELSALEFRLLHHLASHPGMVFSRDQLLDRVWGNDRTVTQRSVDVYIRRVREKIENRPKDPAYVQTVHGVGYRFNVASE